eukprot:4829-Pyramimonas_sp.AAC.1
MTNNKCSRDTRATPRGSSDAARKTGLRAHQRVCDVNTPDRSPTFCLRMSDATIAVRVAFYFALLYIETLLITASLKL